MTKGRLGRLADGLVLRARAVLPAPVLAVNWEPRDAIAMAERGEVDDFPRAFCASVGFGRLAKALNGAWRLVKAQCPGRPSLARTQIIRLRHGVVAGPGASSWQLHSSHSGHAAARALVAGFRASLGRLSFWAS